MCEDIKAITEYWEQDEQKGEGKNMIYRMEANNKVVIQAIFSGILIVVGIVAIIYTVAICISRHMLDYWKPIVFFLIPLICLAMCLEYFLFKVMNQDYTLTIKDNKLVYKCAFITKTFNVPFSIHSCDIPFAICLYEELVILSDIADSESGKEPDFNIVFKNLSLIYDTVNEDGKELIDFLMEANTSFSLSSQKLVPSKVSLSKGPKDPTKEIIDFLSEANTSFSLSSQKLVPSKVSLPKGPKDPTKEIIDFLTKANSLYLSNQKETP